MNEKRDFRQRTTFQGRSFVKEKVSESSAAGCYRKGKLHTQKLASEVLQSTGVWEEDTEREENPAKEVLNSSQGITESVYQSAGKEIHKRRTRKKLILEAQQRAGKDAARGISSLAGKIREQTIDTAERIGKWIAENPLPVFSAVLLGIVLCVVIGGLSSCGMLVGSFHGTVVTTTFTAKDSDILAVEEAYQELEQKLERRLERIERDHPGYDEYVYVLDEVGHDPHELAALLTVLHEAYTEDLVTDTLNCLLDAQYTLTLTETEETRVQTETKTVWEEKTRMEIRKGTRRKWDPVQQKYVEEPYTYEVEVAYWEEVEVEEETEYLCLVLQVRLVNQTIDSVIPSFALTEDQRNRYEILTVTKGNKTYLF